MTPHLLPKLQCTACAGRNFSLVTRASDSSGSIAEGTVRCQKCGYAAEIRHSILLWRQAAEGQDQWDDIWESSSFAKTVGRINKGLSAGRDFLNYHTTSRIAARNRLKAGASVELGAGTGSYSLVLAKLGHIQHATLADGSMPALRLAARLFEHFGVTCDLMLADARQLPLGPSTFDLALSGGLVEHFVGQERIGMVAEHLRVAKQALIQVPMDSSVYWLYRKLLTLRFGRWPFGFEVPLRETEVRQAVMAARGRVLDVDYHDLIRSVLFMGLGRSTGSWSMLPRAAYEVALLAEAE